MFIGAARLIVRADQRSSDFNSLHSGLGRPVIGSHALAGGLYASLSIWANVKLNACKNCDTKANRLLQIA
ncbi:hypothetical protein [Xanthomonas vasicola]|nr:hypothetical protein [Xanthomonas vasicola]MDO6948880.1 hypothetical protein [Xanthomonas vasicola]